WPLKWGYVTVTHPKRICGLIVVPLGHDRSCGDNLRGTAHPRVLPQHLAFRPGAHAVPPDPEGTRPGRSQRVDRLAAVFRTGARRDLGVVHRAVEPRRDTVVALVASRAALPPVWGRGHGRALARRIARSFARLAR